MTNQLFKTTQPYSVLYVTNFGGTMGGGADRVLMNILDQLPPSIRIYLVGAHQTERLLEYTPRNKENISVINIGYEAYAYTELEQQYAAPERLDLHRYLNDFFAVNFKALHLLSEQLQGAKIDLVHSNTSVVVLGALYAKYHGIKHLWQAYESIIYNGEAQRFWLWLMHEFSDIIAVPSQATASGYGSNCPVIYSGYNIANFLDNYNQSDSAQVNQEFNLSSERTLILCLGIISERKGQLDLVKAIHKLLSGSSISKQPQIKVYLAGYCPDTIYTQELKEFIRQNQLDEVIVLTGLLSHNEVIALLKQADLVVQPSPLPDPYPTTIIEAMLAGKPIIASRNGGILEMIDDGKTGLLYQPGQITELAEKIILLLSQPELTSQLAQNAAATAITKFDIQHTVDTVLTLYHTILSGPSTSNNFDDYWQMLLFTQVERRESDLIATKAALQACERDLEIIHNSRAWWVAKKMQQIYQWFKQPVSALMGK